MATFRLVASGSLDTSAAEFVFETSGGNTYLKFGFLNVDDRRLLSSIIAGGRVGFFENNQEVANARILADYDVTNGIQIDSVPSVLSVGSTYEIKWTQARPGEPAPPTEAVVDQGIVRFSKAIDGEVGVPMQFSLDYRVVDKQYIAFAPRFYASPVDFDTDRPIPLMDPKYPENVRIDPPLPFLTPGFYVHDIQLTPTYDGALLISVDLLEAEETEPDPIRPTAGLLVVDANDNAVVDRHGNFVIENSNKTYTYETDVNGNFEVDVHGNRVLEIVSG